MSFGNINETFVTEGQEKKHYENRHKGRQNWGVNQIRYIDISEIIQSQFQAEVIYYLAWKAEKHFKDNVCI